jgi:hypothetical protein
MRRENIYSFSIKDMEMMMQVLREYYYRVDIDLWFKSVYNLLS